MKSDDALLATLGYKQEFKRAFAPLEVFGIAFSSIGLFPSLASVLIYSLPHGGPAMIWGWVTASFFILCVGMAMGELASAAPTSGGLYFWTFAMSPPRWRNLLCWIVGYANTVGTIAAFASIDWGCTVQIMAAASIGSNGSFQATDAQRYGVYAAIVVVHAFMVSYGTVVLARLQNLYIILNIALCLAIIVALPVATPSEFKNTASFALGHFTNESGWNNGFSFILGMLAPCWTICSFDSSVHISEEASNASIVVPWAIVLAIGIAGVLGMAVNMALAFCMGTDLNSLLSSDIGQPMASILFNSFGRKATLGIWVLVAIVQFMMGSSMLLATSRQTFAFARDGALPFSSYLYRINSFTGTPVNTVWFSAFGALLLCLLVFAGQQAIDAVFAVSVTALYVAYSTPIAARWIWHKENDWKSGPFNLGIFSLPITIIAVGFMTLMTIVFAFPATPQVTPHDMNYSVVVLGGVLVLCLVWYWFPKYGGVHWFRGPVKTVESAEKQLDSKKDCKGDIEASIKRVSVTESRNS